jgi:hypothetical protein
MSSGIKSIFKILIGVILFMTIGMFIVELYNITIASELLKSTAHTTLSKSCDYFAQESYKNGSGNAYQLVGYDNSVDTSLNGQFYFGSTEQVYDRLYANSGSFANYVNSFKDKFRKLKVLGKGLGITGDALLDGEDTIASDYRQGLVTPLNIGIAYLDRDTVNKIFKWELVAVLSAGNPDMVITNPADGSNPYVVYKGFRIYYNSIYVDNPSYRAYDLFNATDKKDFEKLTNIDTDRYILNARINENDERRYVVVASMKYKVRVGYEGITPIKRLFQWVVNTGDDERFDTNRWQGETTLSRAGARNEDFFGSGLNYDSSVGVGNKIIYYIIR